MSELINTTGKHFANLKEQVIKALDGSVPDGQEYRNGSVKECKAVIINNFDDAVNAAMEEKCRADTYQILLSKYMEKLRSKDADAPSDEELAKEYSAIMIEKEKNEISRYNGFNTEDN